MLNSSSGTSSANPVLTPMKKQKAKPSVPALVATTLGNLNLHNVNTVSLITAVHPRVQTIESSGSSILTHTSVAERTQRAQLAKAQLELAEARVTHIQAEMDVNSGSQTRSVARIKDVTSDAGPASGRPTFLGTCSRSSAELPNLIRLDDSDDRLVDANGPPTTLRELPLGQMFPSGESDPTNLGHSFPQGESGSAQNHTFALQHITNEGCSFGTATNNHWESTSIAVDNVVNIAEERRQEVMINMSSAASQSHQNELAQLAFLSQCALQNQAAEYANATERLKQEAVQQAET